MTWHTIKYMLLQEAGSSKHERSAAFAEIKAEIKATFSEEELADYGGLVSRLLSQS